MKGRRSKIFFTSMVSKQEIVSIKYRIVHCSRAEFYQGSKRMDT